MRFFRERNNEMKEHKRALFGALWGVLYGGAAMLSALLLIKFSGILTAGIEGVGAALMQLRSARLCLPWLIMPVTGGIGFLWEKAEKKRTLLACILGLSVLPVTILICLCMTRVNGIYLLAVLRQLLILL